MLQPNVVDSWTIREKLCLASCVLRMNENWTLISKHMRQFPDIFRRPTEFFSQKNCAQQYTSLVDTLGPQKRRRSGDYSADSIAAQIVNKLTNERLEELKQIINREKLMYKKMRKEIEAIKSGELDHQLDFMLEQAEIEERSNKEFYASDDSNEETKQASDASNESSSAEIVAEKISAQTVARSESPSKVSERMEFSPPACIPPAVIVCSPSKPVSAPISIIQTAPAVSSPSMSPITVFTQLSPTLSVSESPPQKIENTSLNRSELAAKIASPTAKTVPIKEEMSDVEKQPIAVDARSKDVDIVADIKDEAKEIDEKLLMKAPLVEPSTLQRRMKRNSGGSTSSDGSGLTRESVSSRSPHPIPGHFPDLETYRTWKRMIVSVFNVAAGHKHANLFNKPVLDDVAPNYSKIVHKPMCLADLKKAIDAQAVTTVAEFRRDLLLIFANAVMYNPQSHDVHKMSVAMFDDVVPRMEELLAPPPVLVEATPGKSLRSTRGGAVTPGYLSGNYEKSTRKREIVDAGGSENVKRKC